MTRDPIVEEVRAFRDEIAKALDYDIDAIFEAFRARESACGEPRVSLPPLRPYSALEEEPAQRQGTPGETSPLR